MTRWLCLTMLLLAAAAAAAEPLTLDDALALAAARNPELAAAAAARDAAGAAARQAGAWPNPRLFLELENAPRDGDLWGGGERITGLEWSVPWRGVRGMAAAAAHAEAEAAAARREATARDVAARVHTAFADVLHARARTELLAAMHESWLESLRLAERREAAGDSPATATARARLAAAAVRADLEAAAAERREAEAALAALLDVPPERAASAAGDLGGLRPPPAAPGAHPAHLAAESAARAAALRARAAGRDRLPELDLGFGIRRPGGGGEHALDLGVSLELPLFDRRGAAAARRRAEARGGEAVRRAAALELERRRRAAAAELARAEARWSTLEAELRPTAQALEDTAAAAYAAGEIAMSELIQVRREATAVRLEALDAARDVERARAEARAWAGAR